MGKVLGIIGSPVKVNNTDTSIKNILEDFGEDQDFINFQTLKLPHVGLVRSVSILISALLMMISNGF